MYSEDNIYKQVGLAGLLVIWWDWEVFDKEEKLFIINIK